MSSRHMHKVSKLESGTVLDHLKAGKALRTLKVLRLTAETTVTVGLNLQSKRHGKKDIIKIEGYELTREEAAKVALISPEATLAIIRDYKVADKSDLHPPDRFRGLIRCLNPACIVHQESIPGSFVVESSEPITVRCEYCDHSITADEFEFE